MENTAKKEYGYVGGEQQRENRRLVLEGVKQVREGKTRDFNEVCDRLEKKYTNAVV